jgi:uncharacterized membrane protein
MTGTLGHLFIAMLCFIGSHIFLSSALVREPLIAKIGDGPFKGIFSLIAVAAMYWLVSAFINAPYVAYWEPHTAFKHVSLSLMVIALIGIIAGLTPANPTLVGANNNQFNEGPHGIFRITRHPMMWGIALWGILHVLANGNAASLIFFGGFAFLAIIGTHQVDRRKARTEGEAWQAFAAKTSHFPFAAILAKRTKFSASEIGWRPVLLGFGLYLILLILHETLFDIAPMPWVSGLFD